MSTDDITKAESPPSIALEHSELLAVTTSDRAIWLELAAVVAIGILPWLSNALLIVVSGPPRELPYWLDATYMLLRDASVCFAVLYLIGRTGEPWKSFGLVRPRPIDLWLGLLLLGLSQVVWIRLARMLPVDTETIRLLFPLPRTPLDYVLMLFKSAAIGFTEELVSRAYLITRLNRLTKSPAAAVLLSAMLFASYHVYYGLGAALADIVILGLVFGVIYLLVRRIWPVAIAHMLVILLHDLQIG